VLVFDVPTELEESEVPVRPVALGLVLRNRTTLYSLVHALSQATDDDRIVGLVLHIGQVDWGWAKLAEVRDAIARFRDTGKPVLASLSSGAGDAEYFLASAAGRIAAAPAAVLQLDGLAASALFYRGAFDKLDIVPNFAHAGRFKTGVEPYTLTGLSPDSRAALEALLDDQYRLLVDSLAAARGLAADTIRSLLDQGPFGTEAALDLGLVDTHDAEADSFALKDAGYDAELLPLLRYAERQLHSQGGPRIGLIAASGTIVPGRSRFLPSEGPALGAETMIEALRQARSNRSVKAVVLRIDSPGGTIDAADEIWHEVRRCRETKPVVASMSDFSASGGYYIAAAANRIVAQPSTVTGSIGVYGGKLNLLGLYRKLGLNVETLSRGRHAEMLSPYRDFTAEEAAQYQRQIEGAYRIFLERVSEGRKMSTALADSIGQGRVWSGIDARALGLVDTLGGLDQAFGVALVESGHPAGVGFTVEQFPKIERPFLERLLESWLEENDGSMLEAVPLPPVLRSWLTAARFPVGVPLALMPFSVEIR
jgi:protease-4